MYFLTISAERWPVCDSASQLADRAARRCCCSAVEPGDLVAGRGIEALEALAQALLLVDDTPAPGRVDAGGPGTAWIGDGNGPLPPCLNRSVAAN
jgi:hypothetical protein